LRPPSVSLDLKVWSKEEGAVTAMKKTSLDVGLSTRKGGFD